MVFIGIFASVGCSGTHGSSAGWAQLMGRALTLDDFVVPNAPTLFHSSGIALAKGLQERRLVPALMLGRGSAAAWQTMPSSLLADMRRDS